MHEILSLFYELVDIKLTTNLQNAIRLKLDNTTVLYNTGISL